jgi:hypothetical protein
MFTVVRYSLMPPGFESAVAVIEITSTPVMLRIVF